MSNPWQETLYHRLGGEETLGKVVNAFYAKVARDPHLAPIFPDDLTLTREKQFKFLSQFTGGPRLYSQEYGHPRLRARHMPFPITPTRAKAWLRCMHEALNEVEMEKEAREELFARLSYTAPNMVNTPESDED